MGCGGCRQQDWFFVQYSTPDDLTGRNVEVKWEGNDQWYRGQVCAQDPDRQGRRLVQCVAPPYLSSLTVPVRTSFDALEHFLCRYYDDRSLYFEHLSGSERGATSRLLPRDTYILSTADLIAGTVDPPVPRASTAARFELPGTKSTGNTIKQDRKKCVQLWSYIHQLSMVLMLWL